MELSRRLRFRVWLVAAGLACAIGLLTQGVQAQEGDDETRATARRMAEEGADLFDAGKYEKAHDLFRRAFALHRAPTLPLWEARCLVKLGRLLEAEERYAVAERFELAPDSPEVFEEAVAEASAEVDKLRKQIPTVTIVVRGAAPNDPAVEIRIDGRRVNPALLGVPMPVNPGRRVITALVHGKQRARVVVKVKERDKRKVELEAGEAVADELAPTEPTVAEEPPAEDEWEKEPERAEPSEYSEPEEPILPTSAQKTWGTITLGIGAVGVAAGVIAGLASTSKHSTLEENCRDGDCPPPYHDDLNAFRSLRTISIIGYVVGAVGVTAGAVLLLTAPDDAPTRDSARVGVWLGPTSTGIAGVF